MLHFIPSWYDENTWSEQEQYWYARRMHTEFDDIVKYIQLFHRNKIYRFQITSLSYSPNFRHFLHRQSILHVPYWSCFDAMQCIKRKTAAVLSYHNIKWPDGIEFIYTMFAVIAMLDGKKYAQIDFAQDGNPIEIQMFDGEQVSRKNIYDDRGFVSSSILYKDGLPQYQDYLGEDGKWKFRYRFEDGHVLINPKFSEYRLEREKTVKMVPFKKRDYSSMEEVIEEVLAAYLQLKDVNDIFCVAMHPKHMPLIQRVIDPKKLILSVFQERNDLLKDSSFLQSFCTAEYLICDSRESQHRLYEILQDNMPKSCIITPFDTRPDFGISQQFTVQKILVPVDKLEPEMLDSLLMMLGVYLLENEKAEIYLFTRDARYGLDKELMEKVRQCTEQILSDRDIQQSQIDSLDDEESSEDTIFSRYFVVQCVDELSVSQCLREQRLIVDFRNVSDIYLRIIAISMGIPQIILYPSEFVVSGKNGIVLDKPDALHQALNYYLNELANWNEAMVGAYEFGKQFDTAKQIANWKGVIDFFETDSNIAVGNWKKPTGYCPACKY